MHIHPTAIVDPEARIGRDVVVGPYACIEGGAEIGDRCRIGPHVVVMRYTTLGADVKVHAGAVLGDLPQDLAFRDVPSYVHIGAGTVLREGVTIHRGTKEGTVTRIGEACMLMANSHVAHNAQVGNRVILANGALLGGYVEVGDGAFISGNSGVHQFVRVGRLAMVGGLAVVTKDVPPFCTVATGGRNRVAGINVVGLRRAGFAPDQRAAIRRAFRRLYLQGAGLRDAARGLAAEQADGPVHEFAAFVLASRRGVCTPPRARAETDAAEGDG